VTDNLFEPLKQHLGSCNWHKNNEEEMAVHELL